MAGQALPQDAQEIEKSVLPLPALDQKTPFLRARQHLGHLEISIDFAPNPDYRFNDLKTERITMNITDYLSGSQIDPFPESLQPPLNPGLLSNIDHIVVLVMENRSFDHMLGYLSKHGGRQDIEGLRGGEKNHYKGRDYPSFPLTGTQFVHGPCHEYECVLNQVNGGKMDGFVADFAARFESQGVDPGEVMGYYQTTQVPVFDALAREFLICQRWFCSHPGSTFPNRFYTVTGRLNRDAYGRHEHNNPELSKGIALITTKTIFDHLTDRGVSWHYYEHGYCFLRLFERYTFDYSNIVDARDPAKGFFAAAQSGTLPSVSFIDPNFIDVPPGNDDHPPTDIAAGQYLIAEVVRAVMNGPLWSKTLVVVTYDEHGGFFDHVPPPPAPAVSGIDRYGPRVPTFVMSACAVIKLHVAGEPLAGLIATAGSQFYVIKRGTLLALALEQAMEPPSGTEKA